METQSEYQPINPFAADAKNMPVRDLSISHYNRVKDCPNFSKRGSIIGMKKYHYGKGALLVRCGSYIYNVSDDPKTYYQFAT